MIRVDKESIIFTRAKANLVDGPVEKNLLMGYVCPNCETVVQALFVNDGKRIPMDLMAEPTAEHQVIPKYDYDRIKMGDGRQADLIREKFHLGLDTTNIFGKCRYTFGVSMPVHPEENPVPWVMSIMSWLRGTEKNQGYIPSNWEKFVAKIRKGGEYSKEMCRAMLDGPADNRHFAHAIRKRIEVAEEITGTCPPLFLVYRGSWSHVVMAECIRTGMTEASRLEKEKKEALEKEKSEE